MFTDFSRFVFLLLRGLIRLILLLSDLGRLFIGLSLLLLCDGCLALSIVSVLQERICTFTRYSSLFSQFLLFKDLGLRFDSLVFVADFADKSY